MSYYSAGLQHILANRKQKDTTKSMIKELKTDLPVLENIVDYGGHSTVDDLLHLEDADRKQVHYNSFEKILQEANEGSNQRSSKKYLSFIDYKTKPSKVRLSQNKANKSRKKLKTSIVVQMPEELKEMKNQILMLPSIGQSRITEGKEPNSFGSRLLEGLKKSQSKRYETEISEPSNRLQQHKRDYLLSLRGIFNSFDSPQLNCNGSYLSIHKECKRILEQQKSLEQDYKKFQSFGSPPKRIIQLKSLLSSFQRTIENNMDAEVAHQIQNMDSKRYDLVLKHQEEVRRLNVQKFREKKKQEKLEEVKGGASMDGELRSNGLGFKLNSKGNLIYLNKSKAPK